MCYYFIYNFDGHQTWHEMRGPTTAPDSSESIISVMCLIYACYIYKCSSCRLAFCEIKLSYVIIAKLNTIITSSGNLL